MSEELFPKLEEIIGQPETAFETVAGPGITEEFLNTLNKTSLPDTSSGELIPIGEDMVATLLACRKNGTWPDWLTWFKQEKPKMGAEALTGRIAAAVGRAKWGQTPNNVLLEIHCRSRGVLVVQWDTSITQSFNSGEVLPLVPEVAHA